MLTVAVGHEQSIDDTWTTVSCAVAYAVRYIDSVWTSMTVDTNVSVMFIVWVSVSVTVTFTVLLYISVSVTVAEHITSDDDTEVAAMTVVCVTIMKKYGTL